MSCQQYKEVAFKPESLAWISKIDAIIQDYVAQGFRLTARQVYYQLVAHHGLPNTEQSYKRITALINDAKLAGLLDWDAIEDRTREFVRRQRWESGSEIMNNCAEGYHEDLWSTQRTRVFVIVEKEALVGVLEGVCHDLDVPLLAARGYPSGTVLREFSQSDILPALDNDQQAVILHLGDHDPSGIDMTRDLEDRINLFSETGPLELRRIALNMDQIEEQRPPENPAKTTDSRFASYRHRFGDSSWELDSLDPQYLARLVRTNVMQHCDVNKFEKRKSQVEAVRKKLRRLAKEFK